METQGGWMVDIRKVAVIPSDVKGWIRTPASSWGESDNRVREESSSSRVSRKRDCDGVLLRDRASQQLLPGKDNWNTNEKNQENSKCRQKAKEEGRPQLWGYLVA